MTTLALPDLQELRHELAGRARREMLTLPDGDHPSPSCWAEDLVAPLALPADAATELREALAEDIRAFYHALHG